MRYYVVLVEGGVEASVSEGFYSQTDRDEEARRAWRKDADATDSIFWLDVDEYGIPKMGSFSNAFMEDEEEGEGELAADTTGRSEE